MSQQIQLVISMDENRQIEVSGPIQDKILAYGLLDAARDAIKDFHDKQGASKIVPVAPSEMLPFQRKM